MEARLRVDDEEENHPEDTDPPPGLPCLVATGIIPFLIYVQDPKE